ncbi:hypothetical protein [Actinocatenispora rupis]|uniref:Uncharacterized protein n=1 Tax=Actinocatenispora rupis TaxID=519421 RepID=A0A8J3NCC9_9ACTN|nr:hypothetical protein [Actinocatenispora rupis]GID14224.1 hypothetical protein Aru02nite_51130 [Actinocatenispora rupis]
MAYAVVGERVGRIVAGRVLAGVAAGTAVVAAIGAVPGMVAADADDRIAQTWWTYGLVVFAALFALLAARPLGTRWLWEIVLVNKLALTVTAGAYLVAGSATGAGTIVASDGALFVLLLAAYLCVRGWRAGRTA